MFKHCSPSSVRIGGDFLLGRAMLRTVVVIDYQNVHLTARDVFSPGEDAHEPSSILFSTHEQRFNAATSGLGMVARQSS